MVLQTLPSVRGCGAMLVNVQAASSHDSECIHACRQWHLVDDELLHYKHLNAFDRAMNMLEAKYPWLVSRVRLWRNCDVHHMHHGATRLMQYAVQDSYVSLKHEGDKMIVFDRGTSGGPLVFIFNFHPTASFPGYRIGVPCPGEYVPPTDPTRSRCFPHAMSFTVCVRVVCRWVVVLDSDWAEFGGHNRVDRSTTFTSQDLPWNNRPNSLQVCDLTHMLVRTFPCIC